MTSFALRRATAPASAALLAMTTLTACTSDSDASDPNGAAQLVADGLSRLDLSSTPVTGRRATAQLRELTSDLDLKPSVKVVTVQGGDTEHHRRVDLSTTWDFGAKSWHYENSFQLKRTGERWEVAWSPALVHPDLQPGERLAARKEWPERADVLDRDDRPLVTSRPVFRIGIDRSSTENDEASARELARVLDIDPEKYAGSVAASGPKAFVQAIVLRAEQVSPALKDQIRSIDGAIRIRDDLPLAPTAQFAAPVLGKVGPATAEVVRRSKGSVEPDQQVGLSGLQAEHEKQLRGTPAVEIVARRELADGSTADRDLATVGGAEGKPLHLTLDLDLQTTAEGLLATYPDQASAVVAIQPSTGDVLAVASGPGGKGLDTARAGRFAPGSTFKVVSSLALLRAGLSVEDTVSCPPEIASSGRTFKNFPDYPHDAQGEVPYRTALANSCNTAMISQGKSITNEELSVAGDSLGLGQENDLGFFGNVPAQDSGAEHDASMIGQGRLLASPLAMATVAGSVAAGERVVPRLLERQPSTKPTKPKVELSQGEAQALRSLMRAVVTEGGAQGLADLPGPPVLAKTGTAEYGTQDPPGVLSWMMAAQGDFAVAVFVQDGGYGGDTCLPLIRTMLQSAR